MPLPFLQIDAFTDKPFGGNPAAVVIVPAADQARDEARDETWMRNVAAEMNVSATAFLVRRPDAAYDLRWFTTKTEIDLCGHGTLASAHGLWQRGDLSSGEIARFHTRSGLLTATRRGEWIELDFPATVAQPVEPPPGLMDALGAAALHIAKSKFDYLVEVESEDVVRGLNPDYTRLRTLPMRGVIVTSRAATEGWDFVSRFFAPGFGIDEDPVTGSAHCALTPYWSKKLGRTSFTARQMSPRGGTLQVELKNTGAGSTAPGGDRVLLRGRAVTVFRGEIL